MVVCGGLYSFTVMDSLAHSTLMPGSIAHRVHLRCLLKRSSTLIQHPRLPSIFFFLTTSVTLVRFIKYFMLLRKISLLFFVSVRAPLIRSTCFVMKNLTHSTPTHLGREEEEMMRSSNLSSTSLNHLLFFFFFFLTHDSFLQPDRVLCTSEAWFRLLLQFATSQKRGRTVPPFQNAAPKQRSRPNRSDN